MSIRLEEKMKHLEMIQGVIGRLASNSFLIKGWAITVALAGAGFSINQSSAAFNFLLFVVIVLFWFLDAYYLRQEKLFRSLYSACVDDQVKMFDMQVSQFSKSTRGMFRLMFSFPMCVFYCAILIILFLVFYSTVETYPDVAAMRR